MKFALTIRMDQKEPRTSQTQLTPGRFNPLQDDVHSVIKKSIITCLSISQQQSHELSHNSSEIHKHPFHCSEKLDQSQTISSSQTLEKVLITLSLPPKFTTVRVNLMNTTLLEAQTLVVELLKHQYESRTMLIPSVYPHHMLPDLLVVESCGWQNVNPSFKEVIVGRLCGSAVLRGADVFAPGVLGAPSDLRCGDSVSIFADVDDKCLRGSKSFGGRKMFVGNGVAVMSRHELYKINKCNGVAIIMKEKVFDAPSLGEFQQDKLFLQNLPSVVCGHVLNPEKGSTILDMCAAPGGKATHIATLMGNTGQVIAIDRSQSKVEQIMLNANKLGLSNVIGVKYDSTKLVDKSVGADKTKINLENICKNSGNFDEENSANAESSSLNVNPVLPPYKATSFKWIILDAPCSALGQRPQIQTKMTLKELNSYPAIQRKLLQNAVELLEPGGKLVYSTCTITIEENEKMVKWVLDEYGTQLKLVDCGIKLGLPGLPHCGLSKEQCDKVRRFGPSFLAVDNLHVHNVDKDTIGFFVAAFRRSDF